jgi:hypothetical protein
MPTTPSTSPNVTIASPFRGEPADSVDAATRPNTMTLTYSADWNFRAISAIGGARNIISRMANDPPTNEVVPAMNIAGPALPCLDKG